jgi:inorganic phosphate transporter, PiT family
LAAASGSNDDPKDVAMLGGAVVPGYRNALAWGVVTTLAGSVVSVPLAAGLTKLFSNGIVTAHQTPAFAISVLVGATGWVVLATVARLPVSTTHALVGSLVGAGLVLGPATIAWGSLATGVAVPLGLSVVMAYAASGVFGLVLGRVSQCVFIEVAHPAPGTPSGGASSATMASVAVIRTGTVEACRGDGPARRGTALTIKCCNGSPPAPRASPPWSQRHLEDRRSRRVRPRWARHHHDPPRRRGRRRDGRRRIIGGLRVARRLGDDDVATDHRAGATANLAAAPVVGLGAIRAGPCRSPMSRPGPSPAPQVHGHRVSAAAGSATSLSPGRRRRSPPAPWPPRCSWLCGEPAEVPGWDAPACALAPRSGSGRPTRPTIVRPSGGSARAAQW